MKREDLNQATTLLENARVSRVHVEAAITKAKAATEAAHSDIYAVGALAIFHDEALAHLEDIHRSTGLAARILKEAAKFEDMPGRDALLNLLARTGHHRVSDMASEVLRLREETAALKARTCPGRSQTGGFHSGGFVDREEPRFNVKLEMSEFERSSLLAMLNGANVPEPVSLETATREYQEALREAAETYATRVTELLKQPGAPANVDVTATGRFVKRYKDGRIVEMVAEPVNVSTTASYE